MVVGDTQFPIVVELTPHRFDRRAQPALVGVVNRHQHGEERAVRQARSRLTNGLQVLRSELIELTNPPAIERSLKESVDPGNQVAREVTALDGQRMRGRIEGANNSSRTRITQ